jgi:hypothetical protein
LDITAAHPADMIPRTRPPGGCGTEGSAMQSQAKSVDQYVAELPPDRQPVVELLRKTFKRQLPKGFEEVMSYGMIGWVVPHKLYPAGYHCDPKLPLPFLALASQKNFIAVYHMGIYAEPSMLDWFMQAHAQASPKKLDMGKSCIRYKKPEDIPVALLGELAAKLSPAQWIELYETKVKGSRSK